MTTMQYPVLRSLARALFLIAAFASMPADLRAQGAEEAVAVPGSRVSLIPPEEFYLSDLFSGFFHDASTTSIVVTELPAEAYAQLDGAFKPGLKASGMTLGARNAMAVDGRPGFLMRATQEI